MTSNMSSSGSDATTAAHIQAFLLSIISIGGSLGNGIVLVAMSRTAKLRNCTNIFIGSLAVSDMINCLTLPWNIVAVLSVDHWPLPSAICLMSSLVLITCTIASVYSLASVAYVRYIVVTKPSGKIDKFVNSKITMILITSTWLMSLATALSPIVFEIVELGFDSKYHICLWDTNSPGHIVFSCIFAMVLIPVPLFSMTYYYLAIFLFIRKEAEKINTQRSTLHLTTPPCQLQNGVSISNVRKRNIDVTKNLFIVVLAFVICSIPHSLAIIIPGTAAIIPYTAIIFNCSGCINPLIYARKFPEYRRVISKMFGFKVNTVHDISCS
ncbi:beta-3 adrenergic receptor-like [Antedon mediterranea]|uniref:beta-3 adrenergic receptor-like n=1 Tax=Antedon mediterranea TaxID=105859 RepID=UPI003AF81638